MLKVLIIITILATMLRLFFFLDNHGCCSSDEGVYHNIAQNLVTKKTFVLDNPTLSPWRNPVYGAKPPLYPFFLAGIYTFISNDYKTAELIQILLSAVTGLLIYLIGSELISKKIGLLSLIIYSFFLETAYMSTLILSENIYWLLLSFFIFLLIKLKKQEQLIISIGIGVILGLLILIRPPSTIFILPILIWYLWKNFKRQAVINAFIIICFTLFTLLPWTVRNYNLYHQFVLIYTDGGINVWMGNNERSSGGYLPIKLDDPRENPSLKTTGVSAEVERDNFYYNQSKEFILKYPLRTIDLGLTKIINTFSLYRRAAVVYVINANRTNNLLRPPLKSFNVLLEFIVSFQYAALIIFSALSLVYLYLKKPPSSSAALILVLIFCHLFSIALTHFEFRYIMQIYPLLIPLAAFGFIFIQDSFHSKKKYF